MTKFTQITRTAVLAGVCALAFTGLPMTVQAGDIDVFYDKHECPGAADLGNGNGQGNAYGLTGKIFEVMGGDDDGFATGNMELTTPRGDLAAVPQLVNYQTVHGRPTMSRDYDEKHSDEIFIETLDIPDGHKMLSGWVLFKFKNYGGLSYNDNFYVGDMVGLYDEVNNPTGAGSTIDRSKMRAFGHRIGTILSATNTNGDTMFIKDPTTDITAARLEDVQLISGANGGTTMTLLEQIQQDKMVDFYIQDDTQVDFVAIIGCANGNPDKGNNGNNGNAWGQNGGNPNNNAGGNGNGNGQGNGAPEGVNPGEGE